MEWSEPEPEPPQIQPSPPATSASPAEAGPVGILLFEQGEDQLRVVRDGGEHIQDESILRVPATGEPFTVAAEVMRIMGQGDYVITIAPRNASTAVLTLALNGRVQLTHEFARDENFVLQVPRLPQYVASIGGASFPPLGYGRAGRWRLRSVPSGAEVRLLGQVVATDVDVARLEADAVRAVTFTKPGYKPCGFADARISEENSDGKAWTVVTCTLKK
ncbi:MAG: hypothetical protein AB7O49_09155 [Sphingomonadales bacterium]